MARYDTLAAIIQQITSLLPTTVLKELAANLEDIQNIGLPASRTRIMNFIVEPEARELILELLNVWSDNYPHLQGDVVSLALESARAVERYHRKSQTIDIVWTGPIVHEVNLRQTENVLLELIQSAKHHLHVVSFAVYKATLITEALIQALERGVLVSIYLETPEHSENKITYDTKKALGEVLAQRASVYAWPINKRQPLPNNKHGVLHAKAAISDSNTLFISSANLTDYAMSHNIELGVLIQDRDSAVKVENQLSLLVENGIFVLV